jgi:hypothetical protein
MYKLAAAILLLSSPAFASKVGRNTNASGNPDDRREQVRKLKLRVSQRPIRSGTLHAECR